MSTRPTRRYIATIGDVNPIDHNGGFLIRIQDHGRTYYQAEVFQNDSDEGATGRLYRVELPRDVFAEHNDDPEAIARSNGIELDDGSPLDGQALEELGRSAKPIDRLMALECIASVWGWSRLDEYAESITHADLARRWRRALNLTWEQKQKRDRSFQGLTDKPEAVNIDCTNDTDLDALVNDSTADGKQRHYALVCRDARRQRLAGDIPAALATEARLEGLYNAMPRHLRW